MPPFFAGVIWKPPRIALHSAVQRMAALVLADVGLERTAGHAAQAQGQVDAQEGRGDGEIRG